jgi:DNA-directed RNA polymerase specialized sigma24 family protein
MALHFDDWSTRDIATVMKIDENSVRSHLRHARKRLADTFGELWGEEGKPQ